MMDNKKVQRNLCIMSNFMFQKYNNSCRNHIEMRLLKQNDTTSLQKPCMLSFISDYKYGFSTISSWLLFEL